MPALIELIDKQDNFEIVRDQIAAILKIELEHQKELSGQDQPRVFVERANPWGDFIDAERAVQPLINVWFGGASYDGASSNVVERQRCDATYNIDCYGYGVSVDDGNTVGGHVPGDQGAALEAQRTTRLVRNILMAGAYTYLGLRGVVWKRWPQSLQVFQPEVDGRTAQRVAVCRLSLAVSFNELSPQVAGETLETLSVQVFRAATGELYLRADYPPEE